MSGSIRYLYVLKFAVRKDSGIALVIAYSEREAIQVLNNSGMYSRGRGKYNIEKTACLGETCSCEYGLMMESYTNAIVAYNALVSVMDDIKGEKGDKGDKGEKGEKGEKGDKGDKGDPGTASKEAIVAALGYMPAKISVNTVVGWNNATGYVPAKDEIVVYSDYGHVERDGELINVPGIKIGSGNGYVQDLAFVGEDTASDLIDHINDNIKHVSAAERTKWNGKLNVDDANEVVDEALIFNRN